jgi:hypothetical protein
MSQFVKDALLYFIVGLLIGTYVLKLLLIPSDQNLFLLQDVESSSVPF